MRVVFVERETAPERLVCEAEVVFESESGPLAGLKLVGFSLWRSPEGEVYVTFPSRAFGTGGERRFFDYLRSVEGSPADAKRVKNDPNGVPGGCSVAPPRGCQAAFSRVARNSSRIQAFTRLASAPLPSTERRKSKKRRSLPVPKARLGNVT